MDKNHGKIVIIRSGRPSLLSTKIILLLCVEDRPPANQLLPQAPPGKTGTARKPANTAELPSRATEGIP